MQRANSLPATRQQFRHFYRASAPQCWRAARCWYSNSVGLFVCLSHFSTVSKQLNILSYSLQHMVTQPIFTKFGRSHPLRRRWIQVGYHYKSLWHYRQLDLELKVESWTWTCHLLCYQSTDGAGAYRVVTLCVQLTVDLLAIAKFLVLFLVYVTDYK